MGRNLCVMSLLVMVIFVFFNISQAETFPVSLDIIWNEDYGEKTQQQLDRIESDRFNVDYVDLTIHRVCYNEKDCSPKSYGYTMIDGKDVVAFRTIEISVKNGKLIIPEKINLPKEAFLELKAYNSDGILMFEGAGSDNKKYFSAVSSTELSITLTHKHDQFVMVYVKVDNYTPSAILVDNGGTRDVIAFSTKDSKEKYTLVESGDTKLLRFRGRYNVIQPVRFEIFPSDGFNDEFNFYFVKSSVVEPSMLSFGTDGYHILN